MLNPHRGALRGGGRRTRRKRLKQKDNEKVTEVEGGEEDKVSNFVGL